MTQVQICFRSVFRYVALPVFVRIERTGVYVDIGIKLLDGHFQPPRLQQFGERRSNDSFSQRRRYPSGNKNVFSSHRTVFFKPLI